MRVVRGMTPRRSGRGWPDRGRRLLYCLTNRSPKASVVAVQRASLQQAIGYPALHNRGWPVGLLVGVIAEHVGQHLGVEDAARRRDEGAEILLPVESVA